jgi:hypothetical protein
MNSHKLRPLRVGFRLDLDAWINEQPESDDEECANTSKGSLEIFYKSTTTTTVPEFRDSGYQAAEMPEEEMHTVSRW